MINNDILLLINGIVDSFSRVVLTKPSILRKCENKIYQLMYASKIGFRMPKSFIGNSSEKMSEMKLYKTIIKPIYTGRLYKGDTCEIYQTNFFDDFGEDISLTPIYLQEYVEKLFEVRVTVINRKIFSVKIESQNLLDWRKGYDTNINIRLSIYQKH